MCHRMSSDARRWILPFLCCVAFDTAFPQGFNFTSATRTTNGFSMNWASAGAGQAYTVQGRDTLGDGIWLTLPANQPWPTPQTQWLATGLSNQASQFYRVIAVQTSTRGKVLSSNLLQSFTVSGLNSYFAGTGIPAIAQYGVRFYRIVYETIDPLGGRIQASGGLFLPQNVGQALPLLSYQHGTMTLTNEAPSVVDSPWYAIGLVFASSGYATVLADYLGLGSGPGFHPWTHARSEATACVDMLRAARRYCASNGIALNGKLFIAGYSQGGHATMALHRELETYHTNEFIITASAPMAGPYDLSGVTAADAMSGRTLPNPFYIPYLAASYESVYQFAPTLASLFQPPYDAMLPPLFDGNHSENEINSYLPTDNTLQQILTPDRFASYQDNTNDPLRQALRDNDVYEWTPRAPMRMYHCAADTDVIYANSQVALSNFQARGASQVQLIDPLPSAGHGDCFFPSTVAAKGWFDTLK